MRDITYREILENIECGLVIFLEDDFVCPQSVEMDEILCRMIRMDTGLQVKMLNLLSDINSQFAEAIKRFSDACKPAASQITDWNSIADIRDVIEEYERKNPEKDGELTTLCNSVVACYSDECLPLLFQFGLHFNMVPKYKPVFDEYIECESQFKPFLIFDNYNSEVSTIIESYITELSATPKTVTCIIDNNIKGTNRACDIIDKLQELSSQKTQCIIGAVVTSNEPITKINDFVFIDYVSKDDIAKLKQALLRSSYHFLLRSLKEQLTTEISSAITKAAAHRNIAIHLSNMARTEGISNYEVINQWITTICETGLSEKGEIIKLVAIANMLDSCEESPDFEEMADMVDINTHEAFDYGVNRLYQPVAPGDIFETDTGEMFILVGQACDMMMTDKRTRRNGICELVGVEKAELKWSQKTDDNLQFIWINNFSHNGNVTALKIDYHHRHFLDNEVISLCSFNNDGSSRIDLSKTLDDKCIRLIQPYQITYYSQLQQFFNAVKNICESEMQQNYALINDSVYISRICKPSEYTKQGSVLSFRIKRIARLKEHYYLYLYKLFLEHKGRVPFDTINLSRMQKIDVTFYDGSHSIVLPIDAFIQRNARSAQTLPWIIKKEDLEEILHSASANTSICSAETEFWLCADALPLKLNNGKTLELTKKSASRVYYQIKRG